MFPARDPDSANSGSAASRHAAALLAYPDRGHRWVTESGARYQVDYNCPGSGKVLVIRNPGVGQSRSLWLLADVLASIAEGTNWPAIADPTTCLHPRRKRDAILGGDYCPDCFAHFACQP